MKRYGVSVTLHIILLVLLSIGGYLLLCHRLWFSTLVAVLLLVATGIHLYRMQMKQIALMHRLADSIRSMDMTQAFQPPFRNKLMEELATNLSLAVKSYRLSFTSFLRRFESYFGIVPGEEGDKDSS